ncbi:MAG: hypothetical protein ACT4PT_05970 [Methanobacteriota archaeon]
MHHRVAAGAHLVAGFASAYVAWLGRMPAFKAAYAAVAVGLLVSGLGVSRMRQGVGHATFFWGWALASLGAAVAFAANVFDSGRWWVGSLIFFAGCLGASWQALSLWRITDAPDVTARRLAIGLALSALSSGVFLLLAIRNDALRFLPSIVATGIAFGAAAWACLADDGEAVPTPQSL